MNKVIFLFLAVFASGYCLSIEEESHRDRLLKTLQLMQERFLFSTYEKESIENNKIIFQEVDEIIELVLKTYPEDVSLRVPCIRLLYIQGNHYNYRDQPVLAQKKLLIAKELCEKELSLFCESAEEICESLVNIDGHLPSFYAMVLRLLGKAYITPFDSHNQLLKDEGEALLRKAIKIREYIDSQLERGCYQDSLDNAIVGNTHIFKRDLASYVILEKGTLDQAENVFLEILKIDDPINQQICLRRLLGIYQKKGQEAATLIERQHQYKNAIEIADKVIRYVETNPEVFRISFMLAQVGQLYFDPQNPFRDLELSRKFFEQAKKTCFDELKSISILLHQGLSKVYQEIAKQEEWEYSEISSTTYLRELSRPSERQAIAYEQLGDLYFDQKKYIVATTLYSNSLSILRKFPVLLDSPLWVRLMQKMEKIERTVFPAKNEDLLSYTQHLSTYRKRLEKMRQKAKGMIGDKPVKEVFEYITLEYKELIQLILKDLGANDSFPSFTLICGGSMSWNVATPYSDVELAFLIDSEKSEIEKTMVKKLATLLTLRLNAIGEAPAGDLKLDSLSWLGSGESPSPRGIMLDPFQLATPQKYFIGTPEEFALLQKKLVSVQKNDSNTMTQFGSSFIHASYVFGDPKLLLRYKNQLQKTFSSQERKEISNDRLKKDLTRWEIKRQQDANGERCSVKHDLYRVLDIILYDLAFRFSMHEVKDPWEIFEMLEACGIIDHKMATNGLKTLDLIGELRIKTYLLAQCQREWVDPKMAKVATIRDFLRSWYEHVKALFPEVNVEGEPSSNNVESLLQKLTSNKAFYGSRHPVVSQSHAQLGLALIKIKHFHEAAHEFEEAIKIDSFMYGTHHARIDAYSRQLELCREKINSQNILSVTPCHSHCKELEFIISHPSFKAFDLKLQALSALKQGDLSKANVFFDLSKIVFDSYHKNRLPFLLME
ncbi:MAG: hypothetical protein PVI40_00465 [Chlamydiota bacterium]|jgi:tetratricopeptide (TPR) repeat protein